MKGWGPKSSICPSKPGKSNFFGGISRDFAGISRRCPKKFEKKKFVFNFRSQDNSLTASLELGLLKVDIKYFKSIAFSCSANAHMSIHFQTHGKWCSYDL